MTMQYLGRSAQVPLGDSKWSKFMPIAEAVKFEHTLKVQRFLEMLRASKTVIGLRGDMPAMYAAQEEYQKECEAAANTPTRAN